MIVNQEVAAETLEYIEEKSVSIKESLKRIFDKRKIDDVKIRAVVHAYVYETLKRKNIIDKLLNLALDKGKIDTIDPFTRNVLRVAVYEMKFKSVPPPLATDAAVRIVKNKSEKKAKLVNALLRKIEKIKIEDILKKYEKDEIKYLAYKYFHPEWFVEYVLKIFSKEEAVELLKANNEEQRYYIRANTLKISPENLIKRLEKEGVSLEETPLFDVFKVLDYEKPLTRLELYKKGFFVVQDLASSYVAHVLDPEPDETILDLASAPGSKASHMAQLMENRGKIIAVDISKSRMRRMKENMKILGVKNIEYVVADGAKFRYEEEVDKVLLDVPCSSTGTLRQFPCVKWKFNINKVKGIVKLQRKMLVNAYANLKPQGIAVYSTCSILFEENEENVDFASNFFSVQKIDRKIGTHGIKKFNGKYFKHWRRVVRTYPHLHDCTAFFIAKLKKV